MILKTVLHYHSVHEKLVPNLLKNSYIELYSELKPNGLFHKTQEYKHLFVFKQITNVLD